MRHGNISRPIAAATAGIFLFNLQTVTAFAPVPQSFVLHNPRAAAAVRGALSLSSSSFADEIRQPLPSPKVVQAVESLQRSGDNGKGGVIASDVAAAAGIGLSEARKELTTLASLSLGDIAVSSESAELIYKFPNDLNQALSENSNKFKLRDVWSKQIWPKLFYVIRISFGVALLLSIFAIFSTIALISSSSSSDDDRRDDRRGSGMGVGFGGNPFGFGGIFGPSPFDFFYYRPYYGYYGQPYYMRRREDPEEMGFLESTFSYIFGDGNPNGDLETRRLRAAAAEIRKSGGVVTAEQLAPFVDPPQLTYDLDDVNDASLVDESYVLPIVSKLGGEPDVTDDGDILYKFSDLQLSATTSSADALEAVGLPLSASSGDIKRFLDSNGINTRGSLEKRDLLNLLIKQVQDESDSFDDTFAVEESEYTFSVAGDGQKFFAAALGVVNLGGALYLGNILSSPALAGVTLPGYYGVVQSLFPGLLAYAILYNLIPALRFAWINNQNSQIKERNKNRRKWITLVRSSTGRIARKLKVAKKFSSSIRRVDKEGTLYDTRQSFSDESLRRESDALNDFDEILKN
eukprot:CAMPEP_0116055482 /NCGR_PEP_ID=MMETSP0322-20121206/3435_1 /TAXON_ID=163516 /ORGANISM="Leptocylindrus danicus var. apora, Strain B651" /LENGTH=574 /DNA_ID=CAMNT_0003539097 /DNA_START=137 /DNA_END=1861 /DNA_ORIENTATION=-